MSIEYYRGLKITDNIDYYTKQTEEKANNFNVLKSENPLKCVRPNNAVRELVEKVVDGLKSNKDSKVIVFFGILARGRMWMKESYGSDEVKRQFVQGFKNNFNLTDIIKEINNEIKVQYDELVEKGSNKCYKNMNTEIKESTKKIFYDQIGEHFYLTHIVDEGNARSLFKDFYSNDKNEFQNFVKKVSEEESATEPSEENAPDDDITTGGRRRRRRRTASKRRSGKRRSTRKRSTKRRGGKKYVSKAGKRKTMKRKQ